MRAASLLTAAFCGNVCAQQLPSATSHYTVLLDAAHGGTETGARLSDRLPEKDLTLALSVRLRSILTARGIWVVTTRESDSNPLPEQRAGLANRTHPSACLLLHATTSGAGMHLYTSSLSPQLAAAQPGGLVPWATAQAAFLTQSLRLSSDLSEALAHASIPVTLGSVSLQPIDNLACPAVILELAPLLPRRGKAGAGLDDPAYQTRVVDALGGALEQWRADWQMPAAHGSGFRSGSAQP